MNKSEHKLRNENLVT